MDKWKIINITEMGNFRAKFGTQGLLQHEWGTFDLLVLKVILGHLVHLSQNGT